MSVHLGSSGQSATGRSSNIYIFSSTVRAQQDRDACKAASSQKASHHCIAAGMHTKPIPTDKHITAGCECQPIGSSMQDIMEPIKTGRHLLFPSPAHTIQPVLRSHRWYKPNAKTRIGGYFALSNVHADGSRTHEHNTLPTCQVKWLANSCRLLTMTPTRLKEPNHRRPNTLPTESPDQPPFSS